MDRNIISSPDVVKRKTPRKIEGISKNNEDNDVVDLDIPESSYSILGTWHFIIRLGSM